jgi:hypothetical protein
VTDNTGLDALTLPLYSELAAAARLDYQHVRVGICHCKLIEKLGEHVSTDARRSGLLCEFEC